MVHCRPDTEACRSVRMDGNATLTIVMSMPTINRLKQQIARTRIRRLWLSSGTGTPNYLWSSNYSSTTSNRTGDLTSQGEAPQTRTRRIGAESGAMPDHRIRAPDRQ